MTKTDHIIIGVDPGPWTGLCVLSYDTEYRFSTAPRVAEVSAHGALAIIRGFSLPAPGLTTISYEAFVVGRRAGRSGHAAAGQVTRNICGQIELLATEFITVVNHSATQITEWCSNRRLRALGLLEITDRHGHARSAARQAMYTASQYAGAPDPLSSRSQIRV